MMSNRNRYQEFERPMSAALIAAAVIFVVYLIAAAAGVIWLKVALAVIDILLCVAGLAVLFLSQELTRHRSLWLSCGFFAVFVCILVSLILNYPA